MSNESECRWEYTDKSHESTLADGTTASIKKEGVTATTSQGTDAKKIELTCTARTFPDIRPHDCPALSFGSSVRLGDAHGKLLEHPTEEFEIGQLHGIDAYILTQLDDDELGRGRRARRKHVSVSLRG